MSPGTPSPDRRPICSPIVIIFRGTRRKQLRSSRERGVDDDVGGDFERGVVIVALAIEPGVALQGAADVVLGVDDGPVVVDLDALELGEILAAAGGLGVLAILEVEGIKINNHWAIIYSKYDIG